MTLRDRVREWLGIFILDHNIENVARVLRRSEDNAQARHIQLINLLSSLNKRMVNEHIGQPREFTAQVLDWETVQAMALAELERNPQKEN
jgi:hypothetical protein